MEIFKSKSDLINTLKKLEGPLGLVPTMGGIHEGHLSLIQKASRENASVIVSVFPSLPAMKISALKLLVDDD